MPPSMRIGGRLLGRGQPALFVAEEGQANDGDFELALQMVAIAAECGADGIEFQLAVADDLYPAGHEGHAVYRRRGFTSDQMEALVDTAHRTGLLFHAACLSDRLIPVLVGMGADCLVVNAMDLTNPRMLDKAASSDAPTLIATLMGTLEEIDWAVARVRAAGGRHLGLLHGQHIMSASGRGVPVEYAQLDCMTLLEERYGLPVGYVDHTDTELMPAIAAARGAAVVTKHLAPRPGWRGPDWQVCLDPAAWSRARALLQYANASRGADKTLSLEEIADRSLHRRSVVAARHIPAGTRLDWDDVAFKRPGGGMNPAETERYLGRRITRALAPDEPLTTDALEV